MKNKIGHSVTMNGIMLALCLVVSLPWSSLAAGRWVTHLVTNPPVPGSVGSPVDTFSFPDTAGHWIWVVWFNYSSGQWDYNSQNPYDYSDGAVQFYPPEFSKWYYVLFYDTVTGIYY